MPESKQELHNLLNNGYIYRERVITQAGKRLGMSPKEIQILKNWIVGRGGAKARFLDDTTARAKALLRECKRIINQT